MKPLTVATTSIERAAVASTTPQFRVSYTSASMRHVDVSAAPTVTNRRFSAAREKARSIGAKFGIELASGASLPCGARHRGVGTAGVSSRPAIPHVRLALNGEPLVKIEAVDANQPAQTASGPDASLRYHSGSSVKERSRSTACSSSQLFKAVFRQPFTKGGKGDVITGRGLKGETRAAIRLRGAPRRSTCWTTAAWRRCVRMSARWAGQRFDSRLEIDF